MKHAFFGRIQSVLFGLILSLCILELFLNLMSMFVQDGYHKMPSVKNKSLYNILCIGDSYTYGSGASAGYTYPEQLQRIFNDNHPGQKFYVINSGAPGFNTSQMLKNLPGNINKYLPDMIIIWGGVDNCWNFTDTNYFTFIEKNDFDAFLKRVDSFLLKLRTYKLAKISIINLRTEVSKEQKSRKYYLLAIKESELLQLARICIENNPNDKKVILDKLKTAHDVNHDSDGVMQLLKSYYAWDEFSSMAIDFLRLIEDRDALGFIHRTGIYKSVFDFNLKYKNQRIFDKLLQYDLENMIIFAKNRDIKLILLTYPTDNMERGGDNSIIRQVAAKYNIPCVDTAAIFNMLLMGKNKEYYFVPGGHFNNSGYRVVAEEIYRRFKTDLVR